ncbi:hypothetical protein NEF87_002534 [Candidatus Lokiarchaeum ossiferum]|uniref:Ribbon-helix-helix protein CopG domain-containing protein n=1 Tax=Candidatus Lokiarchaeum ossiferum TaxID=2951803 RepID=A0ABY6HUM7_9ARCH|nr:hypothetical protein NEF87_002534 [Candidatus Lokiarchaeum sp. B-35]
MGGKPNQKTPSKVFTIRIDELTLAELEMIKNIQSVKSTGKLIKQAINTYIAMNPYNPERPNPKLIMSYNIFKPLMDLASDDVLREMAQISYDNGVSDTKNIQQELLRSGLKYEHTFKDEVEQVIHVLDFVLKPQGQNWFYNASYQLKNDQFFIKGEHALGKNFSIFIKYLLQNYLKEANMELIQEDYSEIQRIQKNIKGIPTNTIINGVSFFFQQKTTQNAEPIE